MSFLTLAASSLTFSLPVSPLDSSEVFMEPCRSAVEALLVNPSVGAILSIRVPHLCLSVNRSKMALLAVALAPEPLSQRLWIAVYLPTITLCEL